MISCCQFFFKEKRLKRKKIHPAECFKGDFTYKLSWCFLGVRLGVSFKGGAGGGGGGLTRFQNWISKSVLQDLCSTGNNFTTRQKISQKYNEKVGNAQNIR